MKARTFLLSLIFLGAACPAPATAQPTAVGHHQFTSDETVKPGKTKEISVLYLVPPARTVSAKTLGQKKSAPFGERVVIVRLVYADGSVWQRP